MKKQQNAFQLAMLGLQHMLAMYAGAILVPLIVGAAIGLNTGQLTYLIAIDLFMCGAATLLQLWKNRLFGIGLPVVLGCTFTAVGPMISIGSTYSVSAIYGAIIAAGLIIVAAAGFFGKLVRFFPPVVTGSVVMIIGISLIPTAMNNLAGGEGSKDFGSLDNVLLGFGVTAFILLLFYFFTGFIRSIAVLLGLIAGTAAAFFMGKADFSDVVEASWLHIPSLFYFGMPTFELPAVVTMLLVAIVSLVESTGVYFALADITNRRLSEKDLEKGYRAEGLAIVLGGLFNAFPYTAFSQNVGIVQLSKMKSVNVIAVTGMMLMAIGLVPKAAALTTVIPTPVLGGAMIVMFGMVISYGIKMLSSVDLDSQGNLLIIAASVSLGLGATTVPALFSSLPGAASVLAGSGIVIGSLTAIALHAFFHTKQPDHAEIKT
ncbi:nucleobase:cation symporter-2 family protein [Bacillus siamensis]|uniref:nucleobase:cation symporter-2 family protein n=1 Tax=Bacillus siamensis TaxID=659243 RepID=UPI002E23A0EA|nr:nucleobase:cation symporter-2 family protein [Bacillus siamensis]MED5095787.1 nucleobase:cation symporter-2 family protein [Bacillus siamensis]